jgi:antitoxin component of MazEF toxin-antitoxin module
VVISTRRTDRRARIILPDDFANQTVVVERVSATELRLRKKVTLAQLVAGITPENLHKAIDTGPATGGEML